AARHHFGVTAAELTAGQAALLATALPNPLGRDAGSPSAGHKARARQIEARMRGLRRELLFCLDARFH
ncbi:MAG: monofunctional biosynthetic peptidoglycan transglycosylase, partial [Pseudomonadota bacterium]